RQARASKGEPRPQVSGRDVEAAVLAEYLHYLLPVYAVRLAYAADLIGEHDFQGMERIVDVLHHLGGMYIRAHHGRFNRRVQLLDRVPAATVNLADDNVTGVIVVRDGGAFTQELGIHADPEIGAGALARILLQD